MELIEETVDKKVYVDGNFILTFCNMKKYLKSDIDEWRLLLLESDIDQIYISSVIDSLGNYASVVAYQNGMKRVLNFNQGMVYSDVINDQRNPNSLGAGTIHTVFAVRPDSVEKIDIDTYFSINHEYDNLEILFDEEIPGDQIIVDFINRNKEFQNRVISR